MRKYLKKNSNLACKNANVLIPHSAPRLASSPRLTTPDPRIHSIPPARLRHHRRNKRLRPLRRPKTTHRHRPRPPPPPQDPAPRRRPTSGTRPPRRNISCKRRWTRAAQVKGRTTLAIAHRLSTIQKADVICFMERGGLLRGGRMRSWWGGGGGILNLRGSRSCRGWNLRGRVRGDGVKVGEE